MTVIPRTARASVGTLRYYALNRATAAPSCTRAAGSLHSFKALAEIFRDVLPSPLYSVERILSRPRKPTETC
jgi:hypothetical protein